MLGNSQPEQTSSFARLWPKCAHNNRTNFLILYSEDLSNPCSFSFLQYLSWFRRGGKTWLVCSSAANRSDRDCFPRFLSSALPGLEQLGYTRYSGIVQSSPGGPRKLAFSMFIFIGVSAGIRHITPLPGTRKFLARSHPPILLPDRHAIAFKYSFQTLRWFAFFAIRSIAWCRCIA